MGQGVARAASSVNGVDSSLVEGAFHVGLALDEVGERA